MSGERTATATPRLHRRVLPPRRPGITLGAALTSVLALTTSCGSTSTSTTKACQLAPDAAQPLSGEVAPATGQLVARLQTGSGMALPGPLTTLAVYDSGDVVAFGSDYRRATLRPEAVAALQTCADSSGFAQISGDFTESSWQTGDGFAAVADAPTAIVMLPTTNGSKTVSAYGLSLTGDPKPTFPDSLTSPYNMLVQLADQTRDAGTAWTPDTVDVRRWADTPKGTDAPRPWPAVAEPEPATVVRLQGADAAALLDAVQPVRNSGEGEGGAAMRAGGSDLMMLPEAGLALIDFLVVLPGDDGLS